MSPQWLSKLVRARQMQEGSAQQALAAAERDAHCAHAQVHSESERVETLSRIDAEEAAPAFVAAAVALQAAAATHAAAIATASRADGTTIERRSSLRVAAMARGGAEELQARSLAAERAHAARLAQRDLDEIGARVHLNRPERTR